MSSIAAIATATGPAALGIIRCSGPLSRTLWAGLAPRRATLRGYMALDGTLLDQVIATAYHAPHSYTGQDMLELSCHGNPFILGRILSDLIARGFQLATPGEFTRRAFLSGKLDLTQAEAVAHLISARSDRALSAAHRQLAGDIGQAIRGYADSLLSLIAQVEAAIDFPEEDTGAEALPIADSLATLIARLGSLSHTHRAHTLTFSGARVVLIGAPNAGKSSLFNALLGQDRAIVSPTAGTTRDYIEADITLGGHAIRLVDTAGLNPSAADIEALGIAKTHDQLATADLILFVIDSSSSHTITLPPTASHVITVANKSDLFPPTLPAGSLAVSAATGAGLPLLRQAIITQLDTLMPSADHLMVSARHAQALQHTLAQLSDARTLLLQRAEPALVAHHLHTALGHLGEVLGRFDNEQILDKLFGQFCIGK